MTSRSNSDNDDDDRPHDERLCLSLSARSISSHSTYEQKDSTLHGISAQKRSARKAPSVEPDRKHSNLPASSVPTRPFLADLRQISHRPPTREEDCGSQLLLGLGLPPRGGIMAPYIATSQVANRTVPRHQHLPPISRPPPGFTSAATGSYASAGTISSTTSGSHTHSATISGIYDNATEDSFHSVQEPEVSVPHHEPVPFCELELDLAAILATQTTISSLTPRESFPKNASATVVSNLSASAMGSTRGNCQPSTSAISRLGNPRSILNERYQKKYNRSFTKNDFVTIRDSRDGDHIPVFSSVFVCPESKESFLSGDLLAGDFVVERDGVKWYKKKTTAEFASAGRAEDCFRFRSGEGGEFCAEPPYLARSREDQQEEISVFLGLRACDTNARDRVEELLKSRAA